MEALFDMLFVDTDAPPYANIKFKVLENAEENKTMS